MKKSKLFSSIGVVSATALALVACGKSGKSENSKDETKSASKFPHAMPKKDAKRGGTVKVALETDSPFTGIFLDKLSITAIDGNVSSSGEESLFDVDDNYRINNKGPASFKK